MVKLVVGMVFMTDYDKSDDIITQIQKQFDVEMLHVETSYSRLWIKRDVNGVQEVKND